MLLDVKNLTVRFVKATALKDICVSVDDGEIISLIGANGAGKTTTLRAISGIVTPDSGEIWFAGQRIDGWAAHSIVRSGISHVPEGRGLLEPMSVLENLELGAYLRKDNRAIRKDLDTVFAYFPILKARLKQRAGSLSGGEQQMLAMGCALMANPKLLLLDEPSSGLSPILVKEVGGIIKEISRLRVTIVLVEQNARMALKLATRGYVLEVGAIALEGSGNDLLGNEHVKKAYLGG